MNGRGLGPGNAPWLFISLPTRPSRMSRTRLPNAASGRFLRERLVSERADQGQTKAANQFQQFFQAVSSMTGPPPRGAAAGTRFATASAFSSSRRWFSL